MKWDVRFHSAFAAEAKAFPRIVQLELAALAKLLEQFGPHCAGHIATGSKARSVPT